MFMQFMQKNQNYFYISDTGIILSAVWNDSPEDVKRLDSCNLFKTFEEAQEELSFRKIKKELEDFASANNSHINWDTNESKHFLYYKHNIGKICIAFWSFDYYGTPVFSSREIAKLAIDTIGEERLIKEYFKIKENSL
jgi:hypothetical protein